ncbi:MAG: hypothetical protein ACI3ZS_02300 [Candidatus Cryptobacteroides sp.]
METKKTLSYLLAATVILMSSCNKEHTTAVYSKLYEEPEISGISTNELVWECDQTDTRTIVLEGKGLTSETVNAVNESNPSAFNINVNGDIILVSPKAANTDDKKDITETIVISAGNSRDFPVILKQTRMDKPLILGLTPGELKWDYNDVTGKTITIDGKNLEGTSITATSDKADSWFNVSISGTIITVTPKGANGSIENSVDETLTISVRNGNSMQASLKQSRAPQPAGILYSTTFENTDKASDKLADYSYMTNGQTVSYLCDGRSWTLLYADVTSQYKWTSKASHILARVAKNASTQSVIASGNLLDGEKKVTEFSVSLARRNQNEGWCKVEYSLDGNIWTAAGQDFQAMLSGSDAEDYTFTIDAEETSVFMIRLTYYFKEAPSSHSFLNFEGASVKGY